VGAIIGGVILGIFESMTATYLGMGWAPVGRFLIFVAALIFLPGGLPLYYEVRSLGNEKKSAYTHSCFACHFTTHRSEFIHHAYPDPGHHILDVQIDGVSNGTISSYTFNNVIADHSITASFDVTTYIITATASAGGNISPYGSVSVSEGANQAFTITPEPGHHIVDVADECVGCRVRRPLLRERDLELVPASNRKKFARPVLRVDEIRTH
jgi:hypothetical protein